MADTEPFVLYDISSSKQPHSFASNPSKARLALRFKGVPFTTTFVDVPDITEVRKALNCAATRKLGDGTDYYTLPMLRVPSSGKVIGDKFEIATWLDDTFPDSGGRLFDLDGMRTGFDYQSPHKDTVFFAPITTNEGAKHARYAEFNLNVDATFSGNMALYGYFLPFKPETAEREKNFMAQRAGMKSWEDLKVESEARVPLIAAFQDSLTSLAQLFMIHQDGPYLEGKTANYADLIVGGWLNMLSYIMPEAEWREFVTWHDGVFGRLHEALQEKYLRSAQWRQ